MRTLRSFIIIAVAIFCLGTNAALVVAGPAEAYRQALNLAVQGHESEALASLSAAIEVLPEEQSWRIRMVAAHELILMKQGFKTSLSDKNANLHLTLSSAYVGSNNPPESGSIWPAAILATLLPGAGHALQGRWNDAMTAAFMVWPMLLLTLWAARRRMGPVTLFFSLITLWFWSGTVFSAISLIERGNVEMYTVWWQGLWQASGLPGRPW